MPISVTVALTRTAEYRRMSGAIETENAAKLSDAPSASRIPPRPPPRSTSAPIATSATPTKDTTVASQCRPRIRSQPIAAAIIAPKIGRVPNMIATVDADANFTA